MSARVADARRRAVARSGGINSQLSGAELDRVAPMSRAATTLLERRVRSGALSARGLDRVRRLARTVADLAALGEVPDGEHAGGGSAGWSADGLADGSADVGNIAADTGCGVIEIDHLREALLLRCQREFLLGAGQ